MKKLLLTFFAFAFAALLLCSCSGVEVTIDIPQSSPAQTRVLPETPAQSTIPPEVEEAVGESQSSAGQLSTEDGTISIEIGMPDRFVLSDETTDTCFVCEYLGLVDQYTISYRFENDVADASAFLEDITEEFGESRVGLVGNKITVSETLSGTAAGRECIYRVYDSATKGSDCQTIKAIVPYAEECVIVIEISGMSNQTINSDLLFDTAVDVLSLNNT